MKHFYLIKISILLLIVLFSYNNASAISINVGDTISSNTTWNADTVKITSDIYIPSGVTLTLDAGVYVEAQGHFKIDVDGQIIAEGSADNKITFTALSQAVGWKGIRFVSTPQTSGESKFEYCTFSYGKATIGSTNDKMGGAIFVYSYSNVLIKNSVFINNYAQYGGAIGLRSGSNIKIYNCLIANNSSSSMGGGLFIYSSCNPSLKNLTIVNNTSSRGGGIYTTTNYGEVTNCIIYGNTASTYPQMYGSPSNLNYCNIESWNGTGTSIYDTIPEFVAPTTGAGSAYDATNADYSLSSTSYLIDKGTNNVSNVVMGNYDVAGKFRFDNSRVDIGSYEYITSTEVCGNIATNTTWSGNILLNCDVTVDDGVTLNIMPGSKIIATGHYLLDIDGCLLAQGTYDSTITITAWDKIEGWQGINFNNVIATNDSSKVEYCKISNKVYNGSGDNHGAIYVINSNKILIRNNIIANNKGAFGGGLSIYNSAVNVIGNLIGHNEASNYGAGIRLSSDNSLFVNNTIVNNKNTSTQDGAGVYINGTSAPEFKNNIIFSNQDNVGSHNATDNFSTPGLDVTYSCMEGAYTGTGNISSDPNFKNPSNIAGRSQEISDFNYILEVGSAAIDAGGAVTSGLYLPSRDLIGKDRNFSSNIDMGAYEDKESMSFGCATNTEHITSNMLWDANIINIDCDVTIDSGVIVTVLPGTKVVFNGHKKLNVLGAIVAKGTSTDMITFTVNPDSINVGWNGIFIKNSIHSYYTSDSCIFDYCKFENTKRTYLDYYDNGGALTVYQRKEIRIMNSIFNNNEATGSIHGSAFSLKYLYYGDNIKIKNNIITNNTNSYETVVIQSCRNVIIKNNKLYRNEGQSIINVSSSSGLFENNMLNNNVSYVGALSVSGYSWDGSFEIVNNIIVNNRGVLVGGVRYYDSDYSFYNNTVVNNYCEVASGSGGLKLIASSDPDIRNNIIYGNINSSGKKTQIELYSYGSDPKLRNNNIENGLDSIIGTGSGNFYSGVYSENIDAIPDFISPTPAADTTYDGGAANWGLNQSSVMINHGRSDTAADAYLPVKDYEGNTRVYNGRIDIGAIENQEDIIAECVINTDTEWDADIVKVTCDITISEGVKLTIKPGTKVLFMGHHEISVQGSINAIGTANNRIEFIVNDTTGFADSSITTGGWNGLNFENVNPVLNDSSIIDYCNLSYAKTGGSNGSYQGGAMYIDNSPKLRISNSIISRNTSFSGGGGVFISNSNIVFVNNVISNNTSGYGGSGMDIYDSDMIFSNNTIVNNRCWNYGYGMWINSSAVEIINCIIYGNRREYNSSIYYQLQISNSNQAKIINCNIENGENGVSGEQTIALVQNIYNYDPEFIEPSSQAGSEVDISSANWALQSSSLLLDIGVDNGLSLLDAAGNQRVVANNIDIGAYEIQLSNTFIDLQPLEQSACPNTDVDFITHAIVDAQYQWQKDGVDIAGENASLLHLHALSASDTAFYNCIVSNQHGFISTDTVELKLLFAPVLTLSPVSKSTCINDTVSFSANVDGSTPITYNWFNSNGFLQSDLYSENASEGIIGDDSLVNSPSAYPTPFGNYYWSQKHQYLYTVTELLDLGLVAGNITSLGFFVEDINNCPPLQGLEIKMGSTVVANLSSTFITSLSTIFSSTAYQPIQGWNSFDLSTPYMWDGTSSIVIEVRSQNSSWINSGNTSVRYSNTNFVSCTYKYADNHTVNDATTGNSNMKRANLKIDGQGMATSSISIYNIDTVTSIDAAQYYVIASNQCGIVQSSNAILTVQQMPELTAISASDNICEDASYTYVTTVTGTLPITYNWYKDGDSIMGANTLSYNITAVDNADDGNYLCKATNMCGTDSTNQSVLMVNEKPTISTQPSPQTVCEDNSVMFSVQATGMAALSYQWYKGGAQIGGANNTSYLISQVALTDDADYYCEVTNSCGVDQSISVGLTVDSSVIITNQSISQTYCEGVSPTLNVTTSGTSPITYQWYYDNNIIAGQVNSSYSIASLDTVDAGDYYVIASNNCNSVQSNLMNLTVNQSPSITAQPISATVCEGNSTQLNVNAAGTAPLTYQWYKTNSIISNGISAMYLISQATTADSTYYYVKITNSCGDITSNSADVVVNASPSIDSQSGDLNQCEGTQALFDISTTGTAPLTYQWYNDDGLISGANANSYSIPLISDTDASDYFCEVNNSCGSEVSSDKTLSVKVSPTLVSQSVDTTICEGLSTALQISVMGTEPISYQWYKSSNAISGGVGAIYNLPYISTSDDAIYYGKATNDCGSAQTANINISVNELASITSQSGDSSRCENEMMSFEVAAIGTGTLNYQWYKGTTSISGANMATYSLSGVLLFDAGYYHVTVSNMCNTTSSNYNLLTVNENPEVSLGNDTTFCDGGSVTLSAGYGMQSLWSNGSFNNQINVTSTGSYFVNVTDQNGCNGISDTINVNVVYPYASQSLCVVGVDTASNSNLLVWDKPNVGNIESFNLYKESTVSNVWTLIGNMPYDSLSTFVDYTSTPSIKSERYSISVVDSCGNESLKSSAHKTMHLTVNAGQSASEWNLIWNSYEGFTPATYRVYRADSSLNFIKIDSMAASSSYTYLWTDHTAPINTDVYYMIEIVHPNGGCSPSKVNTNYNSSRSNTVNSTAVNLVSLVPDFSSDKTTGAVPVMIMFYDQTTGGTIESWFWNFGDGATSDSQNPVHQYDTEGIYHVALTVTNSVGSESVVKDSYIDVLPNGVVNVYEALDVNVFPNPFKGTTNIVYNLIAETNVRIQVYSSLGKLVANIADENQKPDSYKYTFNAKDYSFGTGVYLLKMTIGDKVITKRLVQIK